MEVIIRGKRCEGKSSLAQIIACHLREKGFIVRTTEFPAKWEEEEPRKVPIQTRGWYPESIQPRNVDILVKQPTEEVWDGTVTIDPEMTQAAKEQRESGLHFYAGDEE